MGNAGVLIGVGVVALAGYVIYTQLSPVTPSLSCTSDAICPTGQICINGLCVTGCRNDTQCTTGNVCRDGNCVSDTGSGREDTSSSELTNTWDKWIQESTPYTLADYMGVTATTVPESENPFNRIYLDGATVITSGGNIKLMDVDWSNDPSGGFAIKVKNGWMIRLKVWTDNTNYFKNDVDDGDILDGADAQGNPSGHNWYIADYEGGDLLEIDVDGGEHPNVRSFKAKFGGSTYTNDVGWDDRCNGACEMQADAKVSLQKVWYENPNYEGAAEVFEAWQLALTPLKVGGRLDSFVYAMSRGRYGAKMGLQGSVISGIKTRNARILGHTGGVSVPAGTLPEVSRANAILGNSTGRINAAAGVADAAGDVADAHRLSIFSRGLTGINSNITLRGTLKWGAVFLIGTAVWTAFATIRGFPAMIQNAIVPDCESNCGDSPDYETCLKLCYEKGERNLKIVGAAVLGAGGLIAFVMFAKLGGFKGSKQSVAQPTTIVIPSQA